MGSVRLPGVYSLVQTKDMMKQSVGYRNDEKIHGVGEEPIVMVREREREERGRCQR